MSEAFIAYFRVSTKQQKRSGLGLDAQRFAVDRYVKQSGGRLIVSFTEVESGRNCDRPQIAEALRLCRVYKATLLVARLDRLARNVTLISSLIESGVNFVAADMPLANRFTLHLLAAVAEYEFQLTSERTKAAFAMARAQGRELGGIRAGVSPSFPANAREKRIRVMKQEANDWATDLAPLVCALRDRGELTSGIVQYLSIYGIKTFKGRTEWS